MRPSFLAGCGVLSLLAGSIAIWYAVQRQMCTMVGGGAEDCAPNIVYLIPGVLAVLVGVGLVAVRYRRKQTAGPSNARTR